MRVFCIALLLGAGTLASTVAQADEALAKSKGCIACHMPEAKRVGPTYRDIARKYAGQPGIEASLAEKVIKGSKGVWKKELGTEALMPPNTALKADDAARLVKWILGMK